MTESRPLRYFVAVAEERSFTRAATRLGIAGPALSRAIRALEHELGVPLFTRSTRVVDLTGAGEVLLTHARPALEALDAAALRASRATRRGLVLAVKADTDGGLLEPILRACPEPVTVRLCGWREHTHLLRTGQVDVALMFEPYDPEGIDVDVVAEEPRVAALPATHPLADAPAVRLADLDLTGDLGERAERDIGEQGVHDLAQLLALVGLGVTITVLPASVAAKYPRPAVRYVPIEDCPPAALVIGWAERSRSQAVAALVRATLAVAEEHGIGPGSPGSPTARRAGSAARR